ncbi:MAG TPA: hypothetical protein VIL86_02575 [Tepidisphaeraceae bacterium]
MTFKPPGNYGLMPGSADADSIRMAAMPARFIEISDAARRMMCSTG